MPKSQSWDLFNLIPNVYQRHDEQEGKLHAILDAISDGANQINTLIDELPNQRDYSRARFDFLKYILRDFGVYFDVDVEVPLQRKLIKNLVTYLKSKGSKNVLSDINSEILRLDSVIRENGLIEYRIGRDLLGRNSYLGMRRRHSLTSKNKLGKSRLSTAFTLSHPNSVSKGDRYFYRYEVRVPVTKVNILVTLDGIVDMLNPNGFDVVSEVGLSKNVGIQKSFIIVPGGSDEGFFFGDELGTDL